MMEQQGIVSSQKKLTRAELQAVLEAWNISAEDHETIFHATEGDLRNSDENRFTIFQVADEESGAPSVYIIIAGVKGSIALAPKEGGASILTPKASPAETEELPPAHPLETRPPTANEKKYHVGRQTRFFPSLLVIFSLWIVFFSDGLLLPVLGGMVGLAGIFLLFRKANDRAGVAVIEGNLQTASSIAECAISGVTLHVPEHWRDSLCAGALYRAEILLDDKNKPPLEGTLVKIGENLSVDREVERFGVLAPSPYLAAALLLGGSLGVFFLLGEDIESRLALSWYFPGSRTLHYGSAQALLDNPPDPWDEVRLYNMTATPFYAVERTVEKRAFETKDRFSPVEQGLVVGGNFPVFAPDLTAEAELGRQASSMREIIHDLIRDVGGIYRVFDKTTLLKEISGVCPDSLPSCAKLFDSVRQTYPISLDILGRQPELRRFMEVVYRNNEDYFFIGREDAREIDQKLEEVFDHIKDAVNLRLIEALMERNARISSDPIVLVEGLHTTFIDRPEFLPSPERLVNSFSFGGSDRIRKDYLGDSFTSSLARLSSSEGLRLTEPVDAAGIVVFADRQKNGSLHLGLSDSYTYERPGEFLWQTLALVFTTALFLLCVLKLVRIHQAKKRWRRATFGELRIAG